MTDASSALPATAIDLAGDWACRPDPKQLGEHYPAQLAYTHRDDARWMEDGRDDDWLPVRVPGPWPVPHTRRADPVWFRRRFALGTSAAAWRLELDGVSYRADAWLNGRYLGTHEGYFAPFGFEVTDVLRAENLLVLRVMPPVDVLGEEDEMDQPKRAFVGALGRWDMNDPERTLAGIWAGVRLVPEGRHAIRGASLAYDLEQPPGTDGLDAPLPLTGSLVVEVASRAPAHATLHWRLAPVDFDDAPQAGSAPVTLLAGTRTVTASLDASVRPWWTWDLGEPRRYDLTAWLEVEGQPVAEHTVRTGFRHLALGEGWDLRLNGVSLYQRGANYLSDVELSSMTPERYELDVRLMREANLNTVHPFAVVEAPALYDECDRQGMLVYQDIPLWLMVDTGSETVAAGLRTFDEMHARLGRHPSVAIWTFGSQASVANVDKLCSALVRRAREVDPSRIAHLSNAVLAYEPQDRVHPTRSFFWDRADADRFATDHGWRRDNHLYPGWYFGDLSAIAELPRNDFHLVTEYGGQALPDRELLAEFMDPDGPIDWRAIARHCGQPHLLRRHNGDVESLDELIERSQRHQAALVRHHTEFIRGRKGDPGRGLHLFAFVDCWPSVTWSVVDYRRRPKPAYAALSRAMAPVQVFLEDAGGSPAAGQQVLELRVVNDGPRALRDVTLVAEMACADGSATTESITLEGVPTDRARPVELPVAVPPGCTTGELALSLRWDGRVVENRYAVELREGLLRLRDPRTR